MGALLSLGLTSIHPFVPHPLHSPLHTHPSLCVAERKWTPAPPLSCAIYWHVLHPRPLRSLRPV